MVIESKITVFSKIYNEFLCHYSCFNIILIVIIVFIITIIIIIIAIIIIITVICCNHMHHYCYQHHYHYHHHLGQRKSLTLQELSTFYCPSEEVSQMKWLLPNVELQPSTSLPLPVSIIIMAIIFINSVIIIIITIDFVIFSNIIISLYTKGKR